MAGLEALEGVLKALADKTRLRILGLLSGGEVCVCNLHESLKLPQPTVSRHLAYLRRAGLVAARKEGLWVHYRLAEPTDAVLRTVVLSVAHCTTHVASTAKDRRRLHQISGCCVEPTSQQPALACCER